MKVLCSILMVLLALPVFAGGIDGGGGNAVVCRDKEKNIISAKMLDLYEGEVLHGLKYEELGVSVERRLEELLVEIYGEKESSPYLVTTDEWFRTIPKWFKFLPEGVSLKPIDDSGHIFTPRNCKVEQVANYYNDGVIYIVRDIYKKLPKLDRLALILHEGIFARERANGIKNSRYTRRVVANLLSSGFRPEPVLEGIDEDNDILCSTNFESSQDKKTTTFYAYRVDEEKWRLQFISIGGHGVYSRKYMDFSLQGDHFPPMPTREPYVETLVGQPTTLIDPRDVMVLSIGYEEISGSLAKVAKIGWKGFDPTDEFSEQNFECR